MNSSYWIGLHLFTFSTSTWTPQQPSFQLQERGETMRGMVFFELKSFTCTGREGSNRNDGSGGAQCKVRWWWGVRWSAEFGLATQFLKLKEIYSACLTRGFLETCMSCKYACLGFTQSHYCMASSDIPSWGNNKLTNWRKKDTGLVISCESGFLSAVNCLLYMCHPKERKKNSECNEKD